MEKLGKWNPRHHLRRMRSQGWRLKKLPLPNRWEAQDRKLRLGQVQQTWASVAGTSGPLQGEMGQKLPQRACCWARTESWHLAGAAVP